MQSQKLQGLDPALVGRERSWNSCDEEKISLDTSF